jgi:mRNA interferase HicA
MKRNQLIKHLENNGCVWDREGSNHTIYFNVINSKRTAIPRHNEIDDILCNKICKQLEVPKIK